MTSPIPERYFELFRERIALLTTLADALTVARLEVISFDVAGLERRIADQQRLCTQIRAVDSELVGIQRQCASALDAGAAKPGMAAPDTQRLRDLTVRLSAVQSTVKQLNAAHQALLLRSRRTANALLNSYRSFAETYSNPAAAHAIAGERA